MKNISELANDLNTLLRVTRDKEDYISVISEMDDLIVSTLPNVEEKEDSVSLFRLSTDARLSLAELNRKEADVNPITGIHNAIRYHCEKYDDLGKQMVLGWFKELEFKDGFFNATICPKIDVGFDDENKITNKQKFEIQVEKLKDEGYDLIHCRYSKDTVFYTATENNINRLTETLKNTFGAKLIEVLSRDGRISEIKFCFLPLSVSVEQAAEAEKSELLSDDNLVYINKELNELVFAYRTIGDKQISLDSTLNSLVQYHFKNICDTLGLKSVISKRVEDLHENERNKNRQIRKFEDEMACMYDISQMKTDIETLSNNLLVKVFTNTFWATREFRVGRYGTISASMTFSPFSKIYMPPIRAINLTEDMVNEKYSTNGETINSERIAILDTPQNRESLETWLKIAIPSAEIRNLSSHKEYGAYYIQKVDIIINNISDLI